MKYIDIDKVKMNCPAKRIDEKGTPFRFGAIRESGALTAAAGI